MRCSEMPKLSTQPMTVSGTRHMSCTKQVWLLHRRHHCRCNHRHCLCHSLRLLQPHSRCHQRPPLYGTHCQRLCVPHRCHQSLCLPLHTLVPSHYRQVCCPSLHSSTFHHHPI